MLQYLILVTIVEGQILQKMGKGNVHMGCDGQGKLP